MIGRLAIFMMDTESWAIPSLVIKNRASVFRKGVQIPARKVDRINYPDPQLFVN